MDEQRQQLADARKRVENIQQQVQQREETPTTPSPFTVEQERPSVFTLDIPNEIPSDDLAPVGTMRDLDRRTQQLRVESERVMREQEQRMEQFQAMSAPTEQERQAEERLRSLTQQEREMELGLRRRTEALDERTMTFQQKQAEIQGMTTKARREMADLAIVKLAASEELQALTGQRVTMLDNIKARMGFEDNRLDKMLGLEKEFRALDSAQRNESREFLSTTIDFSQGLSWEQLDETTHQEIRNNLSNLPITEDMVKQALNLGKVAEEERLRKQGLDEFAVQALINQREASARASDALADQRREDTTGAVIPFEQWKQTITSDEQIGGAFQAERERLGRALTAQEADDVLRRVWEETHDISEGDSDFLRGRNVVNEMLSENLFVQEETVVNRIRDELGLNVGDAQRIYRQAVNEIQFLDRGFIEEIFTQKQLEESAKNAGFKKGFMSNADVDAYLNSILKGIEVRRQRGMSDLDIFKEMQ